MSVARLVLSVERLAVSVARLVLSVERLAVSVARLAVSVATAAIAAVRRAELLRSDGLLALALVLDVPQPRLYTSD